ncbi:hypothetical protein NC797_13245 [Aquibacillus sp. 3ASR75-11]|uniref:Uncharacterized protein n=1 Tax=Terrihalobacillus insolitus TaxID=2950438 RepID=A0A9X4AMI4_9BACI|nr:hypothetical protein [Terrihalobacillus insolitus]MDC3413658.1 hypothetical protein [Terrihalobacillus insolitus]MDC3425467.1 hypothetical protein [Terrihalobacillus insolitus]
MGYILPTQEYGYKDYHERLTIKEKGPFYVDEIQKLRHNPQKKERLSNRQDPNIPPMKQTLYAPQEIHASQAREKIYADLTGKGRYFSETI